MFLSVSPAPQPVHAWGLVSHQFIVEQAVDHLDGEWKDVFTTLLSKLKAGSIYPDSLHNAGDTPNHLYYPTTGYGTAPQAVERYYEYFVGNLSAGNFVDAIFSAGVFAHYMSDANIPVHTDAYWDGHPAYETDINQHLSSLTIGTITVDSDIPDIQQYVKDAAIRAHPFYADIVAAYPTGSVTNVITTNSTIKQITETQITYAISNVLSLFKKGITESVAPIIQVTSQNNALIDYYHGNDYATAGGSSAFALDDYEDYLFTHGYVVTRNNESFTTDSLADYNFLIITAFTTNLSASELSAISSWLASGQRSIFVTGRGDYQPYTHAGINQLLQTIGTSIRVNDDNVYTISSDPYYYKEHYIYSEVTNPPPGESYPQDAIIYHSYAPNSLYFEGSTSAVTVLVNGSKYDYQTDINAPAPAKIWDNTNDGTGGDVIPLVASESLSNDNDRIVVFGASDFSDFSLGPSGFQDDEFFIPVFTKWAVFDSLGSGVTYLPNLHILTTQTTFSTGSISLEYEVSSNVNEVQLLVDGTAESTQTTQPFTKFDFTVESGSHNITLVAKTTAGDQVSKSLSITVSTTSTSSSPTSTTSSSTSGSASWEFLVSFPLFLLVIFIKRRRKLS